MARGEPHLESEAREAEAGKMGKKITRFMPGESETDDVVRRWLARNNINEDLVSGYSIFRHQGEVPRIMLEMYFDDTPREAGKKPIPAWCPDPARCVNCPGRDSGVEKDCIRWPVTSVGEQGPEMVDTQGLDMANVVLDIRSGLLAAHHEGAHAGKPNVHCPACWQPAQGEE